MSQSTFRRTGSVIARSMDPYLPVMFMLWCFFAIPANTVVLPSTDSQLRRYRFLVLGATVSFGGLLGFSMEYAARRKWTGKEWLLLARVRSTPTTATFKFLESSTGAVENASYECAENQICDNAPVEIIPPETIDKTKEPPNIRVCSASTDVYNYDSLIDDDIRLLEILPSQNEDDPILAKMLHVTLQSAANGMFTALSYTWGSGNATEIIIVDQKELEIRRNLAGILRRMRANGHRLVWVDAICINQTDVDERSKQVLRMRNIYATAETVLIAMSVAECDLNNVMRVFGLVNPALLIQNQPTELRDLLRDPNIQVSLESFCSNAYWSRIWIVQEFAVGAKVEFLLGNATFDWTSLRIVSKLLADDCRPVDKSQGMKVMNIRQSWKSSEPLSLVDLLVQLRTSKSGVRHDRVYGLLGLTIDTARYAIEPDYTLGVEEISLAMTRKYITRRSLDIILLSSHRVSDHKLPSWCPDFFHFDSSPPDERILRIVSRDRQQIWEVEADNTSCPVPSLATSDATAGVKGQADVSGEVLVSPARRIGSVTSLGRAWSDPPESDYPKHSASAVQGVKAPQILFSLSLAIRTILYVQLQPSRIHDYSWVTIFRRSNLLNYDTETSQSNILRWLSSNRNFFAASHNLEKHVAKLWHPFFYCLFVVWQLLPMNKPPGWLFDDLEKAASEDMRLMCLDDDSFGIGWAVKHARLRDEVFLLPGCSRPVILHSTKHGKYKFIGDAIVGGIMRGELWKTTKQEHLTLVEIV